MRNALFFLVIWLGVAASLPSEASTGFETLKLECIAEMERGGESIDIPGGLQTAFKLDLGSFMDERVSIFSTTSPKLKAQALQVGRFLRHLHDNLDGLPIELLQFNKIEIVQNNLFGPWRAIELDGKTLIIRMGRSVISADKLRSLWARGKQFHWQSASRSLWDKTNPTGNLMVGVRTKLRFSSFLVGQAIGALRKRIQRANEGHENAEAVRKEALQFLGQAAGDDLVGADLKPFESASLSDLDAVLERTAAHIADEASITSMLARARIETGTVKANIRFSFIGYGNLHWIRVVVGYGAQAQQTVMSSAASTGAEFNMSFSIALVGYTMDVVDVQAMFDRLYIAEGIKNAISGTGSVSGAAPS